MKKKRVSLPRVSILAFSRKDLLAFTEAIEELRHLVHDLGVVVADLKTANVGGGKRRTPATKYGPNGVRGAEPAN